MIWVLTAVEKPIVSLQLLFYSVVAIQSFVFVAQVVAISLPVLFMVLVVEQAQPQIFQGLPSMPFPIAILRVPCHSSFALNLSFI